MLDGGRYDKLCDRMGRHTEAVGFAVGVKRLLTALKNRGVWDRAPKADIAYMVGDCDPALVRRTLVRLRKKNRVVRIFGGESELLEYCKRRGIRSAVIFDADTATEISLSGKGGDE